MWQLQALIFDVDGTLAETERDGHRVAFNQAFAAAGLGWQWSIEQYGELLEIAGGKERIRYFVDRNQPMLLETAWANDWQAQIAELHAAKTVYYRQLLQKGLIPARPGVQRLLRQARSQGVRLAIATTSAPDNVSALLETAFEPDVATWFEVIAAGDIVPAKKPAPDIYRHVLHAMNLDPNACLVIEDSYQGLQSARQAGLKTVVTVNNYTRHHDFTGAALVLSNLGEPESPFEVLAGSVGNATYFDVELANQLLNLPSKQP